MNKKKIEKFIKVSAGVLGTAFVVTSNLTRKTLWKVKKLFLLKMKMNLKMQMVREDILRQLETATIEWDSMKST